MNIFKKNNEKKTTQKLPMTGKVQKGFRAYCAGMEQKYRIFRKKK